jgi:hypothetical protein
MLHNQSPELRVERETLQLGHQLIERFVRCFFAISATKHLLKQMNGGPNANNGSKVLVLSDVLGVTIGISSQA